MFPRVKQFQVESTLVGLHGVLTVIKLPHAKSLATIDSTRVGNHFGSSVGRRKPVATGSRKAISFTKEIWINVPPQRGTCCDSIFHSCRSPGAINCAHCGRPGVTLQCPSISQQKNTRSLTCQWEGSFALLPRTADLRTYEVVSNHCENYHVHDWPGRTRVVDSRQLIPFTFSVQTGHLASPMNMTILRIVG